MQLGQISVCDSIGYNIKSDEDKARILKELEDNFNIKIIRRHHERFDEKTHVPIINSFPHLVSLRTNGNPYFLYLTRLNFVNQCVLIDKKVQQGYFYPRMMIIRLWFDDALFDNTLFEGEMIKQADGRWMFILNDLLSLRNESIAPVNLVKRISKMHEILSHNFAPDDLDICGLCIKRYFRCTQLREMICDFAPRLPYTCRGVYFTPLYLNRMVKLLNFDDSLVKKVVRLNYKAQSDFLLISDVLELEGGVKKTDEEEERRGHRHVVGKGREADAGGREHEERKTERDEREQELTRGQREEEEKEQRWRSKEDQKEVEKKPEDECHVGVDKSRSEGDEPSGDEPMRRENSDLQTQNNHVRIDGDVEKRKMKCFWVKHTRLPDVYELYDSPADVARPGSDPLLACVPTLKLSKALRLIFQYSGVTEMKRMECEFNTKFSKWMPVSVSK